MKILRHQDHIRMPWKNGLGVTEEVIAHPPGSDLSAFGWRLSIAHVGADGPFSVFAGIDRTIALLDGTGLLLDLTDRTVNLAPGGAPFAFSGDLEISSRNMQGPTIDLNIMTRRGQFEHRMCRVDRSAAIGTGGSLTLLLFNGPASVSFAGETVTIARFDALVLDPEDGLVDVEVADGGVFYRIDIIQA